MRHTIESIGRVVSPYTQKFGIARQPGLVPAAEVSIVLDARFNEDAVRGLENFGYIWLHFIFHGVLDEGWSPLVRPPRLGGKRKVGVFATRSPHRPNHLGLSLLKLEGIDCTGGGVIIRCSGADLLDGTPVVDIKPYIPFVEAKPEAEAGFAGAARCGVAGRGDAAFRRPQTADCPIACARPAPRVSGHSRTGVCDGNRRMVGEIPYRRGHGGDFGG